MIRICLALCIAVGLDNFGVAHYARLLDATRGIGLLV